MPKVWLMMMIALFVGSSAFAAMPTLPPPPVLKDDPWDGDWVLSATRNTSEIRAAAADGHRFHLEPGGRMRWKSRRCTRWSLAERTGCR